MKTSNKIFIGLLATIFLLMNATFVDIKVFGVHRSTDNRAKKTYNHDLGNYRYLKAVNLPSLEIRPSSKNHLNFIAYNDTLTFAIDHHIENDTLFIIGKKPPVYYSHYSLYTNSEIEYISSKDSKIEFKGLHQGKLNMFLEGGEAYCWGGDSTKLSTFNKLTINQINSTTNLQNVKVDTLEINMINSRAGFVKDMLVLNASLKEKSNLQLRNVAEAKFSRDENSKVYFH